MNPLAIRLYGFLLSAHRACGIELDPFEAFIQQEGAEYHEVGKGGVLAFFGDYVLCGWAPADTHAASIDAYRLLGERLRARGFTRHMVYPRNFPSVRLTRRIGARPIGVDRDGFVHYLLKAEDYPFHEGEGKGHG